MGETPPKKECIIMAIVLDNIGNEIGTIMGTTRVQEIGYRDTYTVVKTSNDMHFIPNRWDNGVVSTIIEESDMGVESTLKDILEIHELIERGDIQW